MALLQNKVIVMNLMNGNNFESTSTLLTNSAVNSSSTAILTIKWTRSQLLIRVQSWTRPLCRTPCRSASKTLLPTPLGTRPSLSASATASTIRQTSSRASTSSCSWPSGRALVPLLLQSDLHLSQICSPRVFTRLCAHSYNQHLLTTLNHLCLFQCCFIHPLHTESVAFADYCF